MSEKRNSVFAGVVPVLGAAQTTTPIQVGAIALSQYSLQSATDPTARYSTGSTLLDSFVQASHDAIAPQAELTTLSLELKRIAGPRLRSPRLNHPRLSRPRFRRDPHQDAAALSDNPSDAVSDRTADASNRALIAKQKAVAQARQQAQQQALEVLQQARTLTQRQATQAQQPQHETAAERAVAFNEAKVPVVKPIAKVYGGDDYQAMQARAQAGGLVNLDDELLFGGADKSTAKQRRKVSSAPYEPYFLSWLSQPLEDFTASPVPGGWHPTAHLKASEQASEVHQSVLGVHSFRLSSLEIEALERDRVESNQQEPLEAEQLEDDFAEDASAELADVEALGKQVDYLNRRIALLSRQLEAIASAETGADTRSSSSERSPSNHAPAGDFNRVRQSNSSADRNSTDSRSAVLRTNNLRLEEDATAERVTTVAIAPLATPTRL